MNVVLGIPRLSFFYYKNQGAVVLTSIISRVKCAQCFCYSFQTSVNPSPVIGEPLYLSHGRWVAIAPSQLGDLAINALNLHTSKSPLLITLL